MGESTKAGDAVDKLVIAVFTLASEPGTRCCRDDRCDASYTKRSCAQWKAISSLISSVLNNFELDVLAFYSVSKSLLLTKSSKIALRIHAPSVHAKAR